MKISLSQHAAERIAGLAVCATGNDWRSDLAHVDSLTGGKLFAELERQGFRGNAGQSVVFQSHGLFPAPYLVAVGLGDASATNVWIGLAQAIVGRARELKTDKVALTLPTRHQNALAVEAIVEGLGLADYRFTRFKSQQQEASVPRSVALALETRAPELRTAITRGELFAQATCYSRDLINLPAAECTPTFLAKEARAVARGQNLHAKIHDAAGLAKLGMNALLGVASGSAQAPRLIELVYKPAKASKRAIAIVGKGVTFDSGGLSLKPPGAMEEQKRDMAGGAAVLAVMSVIRDLAPKVEVRAYVPTTENMPSGTALRPGDVVRACNGKTIEVLNTDAEGRLILADAMAYAAAAKPDAIIDIATLTGAVRAALGPRYAGILGSDNGVIADLIAAGRERGENLWQLPLAEEYRADINSPIADIKNIGDGYAGTIIGALFLREFTGGLPWAHIDFASTAATSKPYPGHPRGATGFGVRTLLRYLLAQ